jgi:hypothetical protein
MRHGRGWCPIPSDVLSFRPKIIHKVIHSNIHRFIHRSIHRALAEAGALDGSKSPSSRRRLAALPQPLERSVTQLAGVQSCLPGPRHLERRDHSPTCSTYQPRRSAQRMLEL